MVETVHYEGQVGMMAVLQAYENVRQMLDASDITAKQAVSLLGCIDLHLAQLIGAQGEFLEQLEQCGGLLCRECQGFVGFISNLSGDCPHCGTPIMPSLRGRLPAGSPVGA
jgi:hypothetical protein